MKQRASQIQQPSQGLSLEQNTGARISLRLEGPLSTRFEKVVEKSKRTKTSIIEECLEKALPDLEKQYAKAA